VLLNRQIFDLESARMRGYEELRRIDYNDLADCASETSFNGTRGARCSDHSFRLKRTNQGRREVANALRDGRS
jgi:hypothetical protein